MKTDLFPILINLFKHYIRTILRATSMMITDTDNDQLNYIPPEPLNFSIIQLVIIGVGYHHCYSSTVTLIASIKEVVFGSLGYPVLPWQRVCQGVLKIF